MTHSRSTYLRLTAVWGIAWILSSALGCGGHEPNAVLDAADLLERYDKVRQQHDPAHFSESELGEFTVTKRWSANEDSDTKDGRAARQHALRHSLPALRRGRG